jgi:predicted dehydrogenase
VKTHLLAHGSGGGNALIAQQVKEGVIGTLREIHNWTNRPVWPQYTEIPRDTPPVPKGFDWDLWLGPALDRPYHPHYTHTVFRGWYDFGGGSMADMGIYSLWPVFTTLGLGVPISAEAWASHTCTIVDHLSRVAVNDFSYPAACTLCFKVAPENMPALELFWYDGGMRPRLPEVIRTHNVEMAREGILFVGDQGAILAGFNGQSPQLFARGKREPLFKEEKPARRLGRVISWLEAIKEGTESPGSFLNAGPITDTVNLGTVALRAGRKVIFDSRTMTVTNVAAANRLLRRDYRKGWEL